MAIYFSKQKDGSYGFSDTRITPDATGMEVSATQRELLLLAQARGAAIVASSTGAPQAVSENGAGRVIDLSTVTADSNFSAPIPLKTQAASAQVWIQQQANLAAAMGEVFTTDMRAYVKAIAAIASGTDTTSTVLPAQPSEVMTATS